LEENKLKLLEIIKISKEDKEKIETKNLEILKNY
jgi:hypothetical protein